MAIVSPPSPDHHPTHPATPLFPVPVPTRSTPLRNWIWEPTSNSSTRGTSKSVSTLSEALDTAEKLMAEAVAVSEKDHFGPKIPKEFRTAAESAVQWANRRFAALQIGMTLS